MGSSHNGSASRALNSSRALTLTALIGPGHVIWLLIICCIVGCGRSSSQQPDVKRKSSTMTADPSALNLEYDDFDQSLGQGWRALADQGRYVSAAVLIDTYLAHREDLENWQRLNLFFHAGQMYAFAGVNEAALVRFETDECCGSVLLHRRAR
jgi:hypothetical protein